MLQAQPGQRFHRLVIIKQDAKLYHWLCQCDCGKVKSINGYKLANGHTRSCGCMRGESITKINKTHGFTVGGQSGTYVSWCRMKTRCDNPNMRDFKYWGGKGIKYPDKWKTFDGFLEDMGPCPYGHSIERRDNNKNYSKENCLWIPKENQSKNRSTNHLITYGGLTMTIEDWSRKTGINATTIHQRLKYGWSEEHAITVNAVHKPTQPTERLPEPD